MEHLLVEPAIVPDIFCTGLADAEDMEDGNFRFTFYARQKSIHDRSGAVEYVVVARIILPTMAVFFAMQMTKDSLRGNEAVKLLAH